MEFGVLGPVEVGLAGRPADVGQARQRAVLAVLLLELGRVVPLEVLVDRVWGERAPRSARNLVYGHVGRLRALVASGQDPAVTLIRRRDGYLLRAEPDQVDVSRFRRLVAEAAAAADDDHRAGVLLDEAVGLWRGPALAGLDSPWLNGQRARLELERAAAVLDFNDIRLRRGEHQALAGELVGQAAASPADERLISQLMLALYRCGRQAEALGWFEQTRHYLAEELGTDPGPELRVLHEQILRADRSLALVATHTSGAPVAVPRELPADVPGFIGRVAELADLDRLLPGPAQAGADEPGTGGGRAVAAVISAVSGTAGVGKTALALHWAHRVADRFPGGQLYVNLRGFDPSGTPVTAAQVIRRFLDALGVARERVPTSLEAQAGLYRSVLAERKMLIVADNARDEQQVRPLLPASPGSLVLVTSRNQLAGLAAADGARLLSLDVLTHGEARQLLAARIGRARAIAEPDAVSEIARLCACLPLALAVSAARAAAGPRLPLAAFAAELADSADRLDALDAGDPAASVRAVFSWSTRQLSPGAARMFRLLGLHPGPDTSVPAAASLAGVGETEASRLLSELTRANLITEHAPGRYAFHDLLRAYASEQAHHTGSQADRDAPIGRVLDYYLHTAAYAGRLLNPSKEPVVLAPPRPGTAPGQPADGRQALAWFEAEHQVLLAAVALAARTGFDRHAWQLPWAMTSFVRIRGHLHEWAATQRTALAAATRLGDTAAQAVCSRLLAAACVDLGDHDQAHSHFVSSLALYRRLGNRLGEAKVQQSLGVLVERQGRYADALGHAEQALRLYQVMGDKAGEAGALNNVGFYHGPLGDYQQARAFCRRAATLCAEIGERSIAGFAWDSVGSAEHHLGNLAEAAACYQRALSRHQEAGYRFYEADTLTHLGDTFHAAGELAQAREAWQQALAILEDLQHPNADQVRAKLAAFGGGQD
jgi:DNA-binding SARP family transcriptional activator/tetratricopeptide (TPR) repeat protein